MQNKLDEIAFFSRRTEFLGKYDVFTDEGYKRILSRTIGNCMNNTVVLDLGCGTGSFTSRLSVRGYYTIGVDICRDAVSVANKLLKNCGFYDLLVADGEYLPFRESVFDPAFCGGILHHFPDLENVASELSRCIEERGQLGSFEPNASNPFAWMSMSPSSLLRVRNELTVSERPLKEEELNEVFYKIGFSCLRFEPINVPFKLQGTRFRILLNLIRNLIVPVIDKLLPRDRRGFFLVLLSGSRPSRSR